MVIHITNDLMMASSVRAAARGIGREYLQANLLSQIADRLSIQDQVLLIVDLQAPGLSLAELAATRSHSTALEMVLYAQHVHDDLLAEANGIPNVTVLTRGQFSRSIPQLIGNPK